MSVGMLAQMHVWMTLGFVGFHAATSEGQNLSVQGRLGGLAMGACGVLGFLALFSQYGGRGGLRDAMMSYWEGLRASGAGAGAWCATVCLAGATLAIAGWVGNVHDEMKFGLLEGLRNGVFLMVFAYIVRFRLRWGVATALAWAAMDLAAFGFAGGGTKPYATANGVIMMASGLMSGLLLLSALSLVDRTLHVLRSR